MSDKPIASHESIAARLRDEYWADPVGGYRYLFGKGQLEGEALALVWAEGADHGYQLLTPGLVRRILSEVVAAGLALPVHIYAPETIAPDEAAYRFHKLHDCYMDRYAAPKFSEDVELPHLLQYGAVAGVQWWIRKRIRKEEWCCRCQATIRNRIVYRPFSKSRRKPHRLCLACADQIWTMQQQEPK